MENNNTHCYKYPRAAITVDIILQYNSKILLIKRANNPFKNQWALPGGFMDMGETLEYAAKRELAEETALNNIYLHQFKTYSEINRDPRHRTISTVFFHISNDTTPDAVAGDDAKEAKWWHINNLPKIAFDHNLIINDFIESKKVR